MSSRDDILRALRANRPPAVDLPEIEPFEAPAGSLPDCFAEALEAAGGAALRVDRGRVAEAVAERYPGAEVAAAPVADATKETLAAVDVLVCEGVLGVAENGAVWVPEAAMGQRAAPFLAQHLVLVLSSDALVWNMHEAYARLDVAAEGFGAFIAGPSKTADIEQSLVIGAHGPRSLTVLLVP